MGKKALSIRLDEDKFNWVKNQGSVTKVIEDLISRAMKRETGEPTETKIVFPQCSKLKYHKYLKVHYCLDRIKAKTLLPKYIKKAKVTAYDCETCLMIKRSKMPYQQKVVMEKKESRIITDRERATEYFTCKLDMLPYKILDLPCIKNVDFNCSHKLCEKQIRERIGL